ncbi:electron-transfer-flavoprotein, alpha polypeptide [Besnoitia besnoiti]|uniref:Electron transfer flavoprotein subunit alpha n=1 Tax=Besnoitia besnoiti TaxID=94643 RepID=A0A2A9MED4_BESBE|nr:electron-transfer-flavoprotein, alpha polypeptide [Besnoitia besnoiti]PFH36878.1 electron-transfer-flavoprotein, alpha polypeptide [Besnoitia besnoiti]
MFSKRCFSVSLVVAEHKNVDNQATTSKKNGPATVITTSTLAAIQASSAFLQPVEVLVCAEGSAADSLTDQLRQRHGVAKVLRCSGNSAQICQADALALLISRLQRERDVSVICGAAGSVCRDVLPRLAALLDVQPIADVVAIKTSRSMDAVTFVRPVYAGSALCSFASSEKIKIVTVRTAAFTPGETAGTRAAGDRAPVEDLCVTAASSDLAWLTEDLTATNKPQLDAAEVVVTGGRGLKSASNFSNILEPLRAKLRNAAIGASRAAVDAGYASNDLQIGQTGKVVAPRLYIAVGVSGASQHLAGMKDSKVVVAINNDPCAPIFQVSDYYLEGDLFQAVPELTSKLPEQ